MLVLYNWFPIGSKIMFKIVGKIYLGFGRLTLYLYKIQQIEHHIVVQRVIPT